MYVDYKRPKYPNRLKVIRQNAGFTQRHVAAYLGQPDAVSLSQWENEKTMPTGTNLIRLCILYGVTPRELYPEYYELVERDFPNKYSNGSDGNQTTQ